MLSTNPNSSSLLEGTDLMITCLANISSSVNVDTGITFDWSVNGGDNIMNSSKHSIYLVNQLSGSSYQNTLLINQLNSTDNESVYSCTVSIQPTIMNDHIIGSSSSKSIVLKINGL